ncbi:MAG: hypothetical protein PWR20_18 [Bacteroidales bacterium]|jgi:hypothetical protein|nr:hypothetical protein [Bacteroidales bacterium]MDN5328593.1 hypothetical protein [Bacteroidales bacterium]
MKCLVSIISEQALPNYLFIKELEKEIDKYIFISTKEMEENKKTEKIFMTVGIDPNKKNKILVEEDTLADIIGRMSKLKLDENDTFYINLTGGTKIMSIAVWNFFHRFNNKKYYYVPIGKNSYNEIFIDKPAQIHPFTYSLSCEEYLKIYGINFEQEKFLFDREKALILYERVKAKNFMQQNIPQLRVNDLGLKYTNQKTKEQIITKWFEEYLYYKIKEELKLEKNAIKKGIKLFNTNTAELVSQNDNEIDIFFMYKNNPYIVEAKFSLGNREINSTYLYNHLYKVASVNKRFGLRARSTLMTLADFTTRGQGFKESLEKRSYLLGTFIPFDRNDIINKDAFRNKLIQFCK